MILRSSYFMLRRMLRGYLALVILIGTPLALITVLGMVAGNAIDSNLGIPIMGYISATMILSFQFYGGFYTLEYIRNDLMTSSKWRIHSLPYSAHTHGFSILLACTLFSALQGLAMVLFTQQVYGVKWGNIGLVLLILITLATLSQLVFFNLLLGMKSYKNAERLGTAFGLVSTALAGTWFTMPDTGFWGFISTYGNPLSLGQNAVYAIMTGENMSKAIVSFGILVAASGVMAIIAIFLGKRRLAA